MLAHVLKGYRANPLFTSTSSPLQLTKALSSSTTPVRSVTTSSTSSSSSSSSSSTPKPLTELLSDPTQQLEQQRLDELLHKKKKKEGKKQQNKQQQTTKDKWYSLKTPQLTPEVKRDLQVLSMRHLIYKDQHFKRPDRKKGKLPEKFELGEVISSSAEFYSSRLSKAERSKSFLEEVYKDEKMQQFAKKKWKELQIDPSKTKSKEAQKKSKLKERLALKKKIDRRKSKTKPGEKKKLHKKGRTGSSNVTAF